MTSINERTRDAGARLAQREGADDLVDGYVADLAKLVNRTLLASETIATVLAELSLWEVRR